MRTAARTASPVGRRWAVGRTGVVPGAASSGDNDHHDYDDSAGDDDDGSADHDRSANGYGL